MARKRGRRFNPLSQRNRTTRRGRAGFDDRDYGSDWLIAKKMAYTTRSDVELTGPGILYGRGYIDAEQYDKLAQIGEMLRKIQLAMGKQIRVDLLWRSIMAAGVVPTRKLDALIGDRGARIALEKLVRNLNGSRDLVLELAGDGPLPRIVMRAAERSLTPVDLVRLETLRQGLDAIVSR